MPDKCDEKLLGKWYCDTNCAGWSCTAIEGERTFSRTVDGDGYEEIQMRLVQKTLFISFQSDREYHYRWRVDRTWRPNGQNPFWKEKLFAASCNGKVNVSSTLSVNYKNPDGSDRWLRIYAVNPAEKTLTIESYRTWWVGEEMHSRLLRKIRCRRTCDCDD